MAVIRTDRPVKTLSSDEAKRWALLSYITLAHEEMFYLRVNKRWVPTLTSVTVAVMIESTGCQVLPENAIKQQYQNLDQIFYDYAWPALR